MTCWICRWDFSNRIKKRTIYLKKLIDCAILKTEISKNAQSI